MRRASSVTDSAIPASDIDLADQYHRPGRLAGRCAARRFDRHRQFGAGAQTSDLRGRHSEQGQLARLVLQARDGDAGDLDGVEAEAKRVLLIAPNNVGARAWLYQAGKAVDLFKQCCG